MDELFLQTAYSVISKTEKSLQQYKSAPDTTNSQRM